MNRQRKLDELTAAAQKTKTDARHELETQLHVLTARRAAVHKQLATLQKQTTGAWKDIRTGIENALEDMRVAMEQVASRFKT